MPSQYEDDKFYMDSAHLVADRSYAERARVGAVIVKGLRWISYGYNGQPAGMDNICEKDNETLPEVIHAEANAIKKLARSHESTEGTTLYVTHSPCLECAKMIVDSGIERVVYRIDYRKSDGIELLKKKGIQVDQFFLMR